MWSVSWRACSSPPWRKMKPWRGRDEWERAWRRDLRSFSRLVTWSSIGTLGGEIEEGENEAMEMAFSTPGLRSGLKRRRLLESRLLGLVFGLWGSLKWPLLGLPGPWPRTLGWLAGLEFENLLNVVYQGLVLLTMSFCLNIWKDIELELESNNERLFKVNIRNREGILWVFIP